MSEWKWVPVEPTAEMLDATWTDEQVMTADGYDAIRAAMYRAMLAAAPTPPAEAVTDAMTDAAMRQMRAVCGSNRITREQMWAIIDAALASKEKA